MSVEDKILRRIRGKPVGWVFTPSHFLDQGSYGAVVLALKQICDRGRIRRLARGLYDNPKTHPKLGILTPTAEQIVAAKRHLRSPISSGRGSHQIIPITCHQVIITPTICPKAIRVITTQACHHIL